jgi:hypothetical protein
VDYESLIPYLSESIRANFNDIKNTQAKTDHIEKIVDQLYQQFLKQESERKKSGSYNDQKNGSTRRTFSRFNKLPLLWRIIIAVSIIAVSLSVVLIIVLALQSDNNEQNRPDPVTPTPAIENSPVPSEDVNMYRKQLIELYEATSGQNWARKDNWLNNVTICAWYGVGCYSLGLELDLSNNNLSGTIPDSLSDVPLMGLTLAHNLLEGSIPPSFTNMNLLKVLNVSHNNLIGAVQFDELLQLQYLNTVDVSYNRLQGTVSVPLNVERSILRYLDISHNRFVRDMPSVGYLFSLEHLDVSHNVLYGSLPELGRNLQYISVASNKLLGPTNSLSLIGGWDKSVKNLVIDVSSNNFEGYFTLDERQWPNIKSVNISFNDFKGISVTDPNLPVEFVCDARNNRFECPAPNWLVTRCAATCKNSTTAM